jgi:hypothetical protein
MQTGVLSRLKPALFVHDLDLLVDHLADHYGEMYHQHLEGHLDPRVWHEVETPMRDLINARPGIRAWWRLYSNWFGEEFVNYVNQVQQTATPPRMFREPMKDE